MTNDDITNFVRNTISQYDFTQSQNFDKLRTAITKKMVDIEKRLELLELKAGENIETKIENKTKIKK